MRAHGIALRHRTAFFSSTSYAGGQPGEVGGTFWRSGQYAYYADRVGPLTLDDRLEANGKVVLQVGSPDSDMYIGWFSSTNKTTPPAEAGHFLGIQVGGPTLTDPEREEGRGQARKNGEGKV